MNNGNRDKLRLFLTGLEQRMADTSEYFMRLTVVYTSGLKQFKGVIVPQDDKYIMSFNGKKDVLNAGSIPEAIVKNAVPYEKVDITFEERGTNIIIEADNRNVRMRYVDRAEEIPDEHVLKSHIGERNHYIKVGQANELLKEIGILTADGKVKNERML